MIGIRLKGGLGNFLFQIASIYSLALDNASEYAVDLRKIMVVHTEWEKYKDNIFRKVETVDEFRGSGYYLYDSLVYEKIPYLKTHIYDGYFQCEKYFNHNRDEILELFNIDENTLSYLINKYGDIINSDNTCGIHVRRGNYLGIDIFNKLDMDYYNKGMNIIGRHKHFVIFSDDIEWCKRNFIYPDVKVTFIENDEDYQDLYLMSLCKDNIMANSSFSWWGSYLNRNENKKIVAPATWFLHTVYNDDVVPDSWIKI